MKIGFQPDVSAVDIPRHAPGATPVSDDKPVGKVQEADRVMLSQASRLAKSAELDTDIRADKVAKMREAIEKGEFKPDVSAIASRMIQEAASLVQMIAHPNLGTVEGTEQASDSTTAGKNNVRSAGPDR